MRCYFLVQLCNNESSLLLPIFIYMQKSKSNFLKLSPKLFGLHFVLLIFDMKLKEKDFVTIKVMIIIITAEKQFSYLIWKWKSQLFVHWLCAVCFPILNFFEQQFFNFIVSFDELREGNWLICHNFSLCWFN